MTGGLFFDQSSGVAFGAVGNLGVGINRENLRKGSAPRTQITIGKQRPIFAIDNFRGLVKVGSSGTKTR